MRSAMLSNASGRRGGAKKFLLCYGSLTALFLIMAVFSIIAPNFLSLSNMTLMLGQISVVGALYITMMINGMQMMGCGNHQQCIMRGVLLLVGLTLSSLRRIATE